MRIDLPNDHWVEVREATFGDIRCVDKAGRDGASEMDQTAILLERIITEWSFDWKIDDKGINEVPLSALSKLSQYIETLGLASSKEQTRPLGNGSTSSSSVNTNGANRRARRALRT